jgi:hypothetical protein
VHKKARKRRIADAYPISKKCSMLYASPKNFFKSLVAPNPAADPVAKRYDIACELKRL